jgi:glycerate dehydrogenase
MKPSAYLINMARGGIVNETDLRRALQLGRIAGAATDVLTQEPPPKGHVLLKAPHLLMTPHVAWASREARFRLVEEIAKNVQAFLKGQRRNRVV